MKSFIKHKSKAPTEEETYSRILKRKRLIKKILASQLRNPLTQQSKATFPTTPEDAHELAKALRQGHAHSKKSSS